LYLPDGEAGVSFQGRNGHLKETAFFSMAVVIQGSVMPGYDPTNLVNNMDLALQARDYVNERIVPDSQCTTQLYDWFKGNFQVKNSYQHRLALVQLGKEALARGCGSCGPQAAAALWYLADQQGVPHDSIAYCHWSDSMGRNHAWLLVGDLPQAFYAFVKGMPPDATVMMEDEAWRLALEWGVCAVCDPTMGKAFPAGNPKVLLHKMVEPSRIFYQTIWARTEESCSIQLQAGW
jgi:hypothetical protein